MPGIIDSKMLWHQFSVAIDDLEKGLRNCPHELWNKQLWDDEPDQWVAAGFSTFWYLCYHTLFWMDLYLTGAEEGFSPPAPFDLVEMEADEALPRIYTREELLSYLEYCRGYCEETINSLTIEQATRICSFPWGELSFAELLLYNMRHVQEHAAQLHMYLGQQVRKSGP
jgi:uncharacterized damage-inducible protein DinB